MKRKLNLQNKICLYYRKNYSNDSDNGTDDTSPTFKAFEEGSSTLSKDENMKLAMAREIYKES